jgi:hypothetical protein
MDSVPRKIFHPIAIIFIDKSSQRTRAYRMKLEQWEIRKNKSCRGPVDQIESSASSPEDVPQSAEIAHTTSSAAFSAATNSSLFTGEIQFDALIYS